MNHAVMSFCKWLQETWMAQGVLTSGWAFPYVQMTHFAGLSLWVGTNTLLDLRLLGLGKKWQSAAQLSDAMFAWNWIGFGVAIIGGFLLFTTSAVTYVRNPAFRIKLGVLIPLGLILHILNQQMARSWGESNEPPPAAKLAGLVELLLWVSVATAAVLIPSFFGPNDLQ